MIEGRSDDVLELPGTGAATISVHPLQFAVVARDRDVVEFQVVQEGPRLRLLVVARGVVSVESPRRIQTVTQQSARCPRTPRRRGCYIGECASATAASVDGDG